MPHSHSSVSTYEQCPAQYDFRYNKRLPEAPPGPALIRGRATHGDLEAYLKDPALPVPKRLEMFDRELEGFRVHRAWAEERWDFTQRWKPTDRANSWVVMITDVHWVQSTIGWVVDVKTGKFYDKHAGQAKLYGIGMLLRYPKLDVANVQFMYTDRNEIVEMEVRRAEIRPIAKDFEAKVATIQADKVFKVKPSRLCAWCSFAKSKGGPCKEG